ncbi:MAG: hypothetical protein ACOYMG_02610 [Candidatus Methylumidiphilus sp.]
MHTNRKFAVLALAAGLLLNSGLSHATDVYARKTTVGINLSSVGGTATTLLSVSIPAGTWKATAKSSVVNFGGGDFARCFVTASTTPAATQIDSATAFVGGTIFVATIANVGIISTTATTTFSLKCQHDSSISGLYVDPDAKLIVERVSSGLSSL